MRLLPACCFALLLAALPGAPARADSTAGIPLPTPVEGSVCRRIVDPLTVKGLVPPGAPGLGQGCRLGQPVLLCEPATLPLGTPPPQPVTLPVEPPPPLAKSVCYRLVCKGTKPEPAAVSDAFGQRTVAAGPPALFCTALGSPTPGCDTDADCESGSFCRRPLGECAAAGVCTPSMVMCPQLYDPVCGCDGQTYPNACQATQARVSVLHRGACDATPGCPQTSSSGLRPIPCK